MKHDWREGWNSDCTVIIFTCRACDARVCVQKGDCWFYVPDEDIEPALEIIRSGNGIKTKLPLLSESHGSGLN